jgi:MFS family permease
VAEVAVAGRRGDGGNTRAAGGGLSALQMRVWMLSGMGVFLDGFDLFIAAVALPLIGPYFHASEWALGMVGSAAVFGTMLGAIALGRMADLNGRRILFLVDLIIFCVFAVASAAAWSLTSLIVFRFLLGVGIGADYPIAAAYLAEYMPAEVRGRMLVGAFAFQALGMLAGAATGILMLAIDPSMQAWRWMLGAGLIPALALLFMRRGLPESQRWAERQQQLDTHAGATAHHPEHGREVPVAHPRMAYAALFSPAYLRRTLLTTSTWALMDMALYGVGMFTPTILALMSFAGHGTFYHQDIASTEGAALLDVFLVIGFALNIWLVDRWGRIRLQLLGFAGMTAGMIVLAIAEHAGGGSGKASIAAVVLGFGLFNLMVNMGPNPTTYLLSAELFPTDLRGSGEGLAAAIGKFGAAIGIFFLPVLRAQIGVAGVMVVTAAVCAAGFVVTWLLRVETAGLSLEELVVPVEPSILPPPH